jgi:hypothetical protein
MGTRYSAAVRLLGLTLLVLAVSPVTAPFSTFDLIGLLNGSASATSSLQTKKAADEPAAEVTGRPDIVSADPNWSRAPLFGERVLGSRLLRDIPLRI